MEHPWIKKRRIYWKISLIFDFFLFAGSQSGLEQDAHSG